MRTKRSRYSDPYKSTESFNECSVVVTQNKLYSSRRPKLNLTTSLTASTLKKLSISKPHGRSFKTLTAQ